MTSIAEAAVLDPESLLVTLLRDALLDVEDVLSTPELETTLMRRVPSLV